jgi:hypothetical protein
VGGVTAWQWGREVERGRWDGDSKKEARKRVFNWVDLRVDVGRRRSCTKDQGLMFDAHERQGSTDTAATRCKQ